MTIHAGSTMCPTGARRWIGTFAAGLLRLLGATWRVRTHGLDPLAEAAPPALGALLHRDFLVAAWWFRDRGIHVAISQSNDGDLVACALDHLGFGTDARGSSSRGGSRAQLSLAHRLAAGETVAVLVDGPRGPAGSPKPGVAQLSRKGRRPITPIVFECHPAWRFGSWDRAVLPLPFARIDCHYGESLEAGSGPQTDSDACMLTRLEVCLSRKVD